MKTGLLRAYCKKALIPGGLLLALGSCPLTDAQIASIIQSAISTSLNTVVQQLLSGVLGAATATG